MRQASPEAEDFPLYIHDGFNLEQYSDFISARKDFVVEDHHSYFVFDGNGTSNTAAENTKEVDGSVSGELASASKNERRNFVVGEWSCALSPDSLNKAEDAQDARQQFCEGQEQVYTNTSAGWYYWSYMKEDCDSDLDWCFRNAVGKTLPTTFFSYNSSNHSSPEKTAFIARSVSQMQLPSMTEVLDQANPQESSKSALISASSSHTSISTSSMSASSVSSSAASETSSMGSRKKHSDPAHHQRFLAIHSRREHLHDPYYLQKYKRDNSTSNSGLPAALMNLTATERSITKGYSDGFMTAKIFAQYGMSRLGFKGQYIGDSIAKLGESIVAPGTESEYSVWFYKGLGDAEQIIGTAVGN
jgi:glucan 1,3-beta-glucosidase